MFIGHALLTFALVLFVAEWRDWPTDRAFALAVGAGAFAALPDVDVLYTVVAVDPTSLVAGTEIKPEAFWETANTVHRSRTHSLIIAAISGTAFGLWALGRSGSATAGTYRERIAAGVAVAALGGLVAVSVSLSGFAGGFVMAVFALGGIGLTEISRLRFHLSPKAIGTVALVGMASHPWGDLVTGSPPALLYPLDTAVITERVVLSGDPTIHLLSAFAIELAVILLAAIAVARQSEFDPRRLVDRRAALGAAYGLIAVLIVPPTIERSYPFVFSILAVGTVCGLSSSTWQEPRSVLRRQYRAGSRETALRVAMTGLTGILIALGSYTLVYLTIS